MMSQCHNPVLDVRQNGIPAVQLKKNTVYFTFLKVFFYSYGPHLTFFGTKKPPG